VIKCKLNVNRNSSV